MAKSVIKTIRFSQGENKKIQSYLDKNPSFESISSLGRVAIIQFIETHKSLRLNPVDVSKSGAGRPDFLWDYDLSDRQVKDILAHAPMKEKSWLIARILSRLSPPAVFDYLSAKDISDALQADLRMDSKLKRHWEQAIQAWT